MKTKRILAVGIAAAVIFTNTAFASDMYATRGEVANMLLQAADDYNPNVKYSDIIKGYGGDGELHEDWNVNRAEALIMLSRAFGKLPELTGHNARVALKSGAFDDIPDWAAPELTPVLDAGISVGTADGIFSPYDDVTKEQMQLFIKRAYALFGTNEKDDFYAAVNKDVLNTLSLKPGRVIAGTLYDLGDKSAEEVNDIIKEAIEKGGKKGSKEQKMADFYKNILDVEKRNKNDMSVLQKYLDMINKAENTKDLEKVQSVLKKELLIAPYAAFSITTDFKDSTKYIPVFGTYEPIMTKDFYESGTESQKNAYFKYLKTVLSIAGEDASDETIQKFFSVEKEISEKALSPQENADVDKIYNTFSLSEIADMVPAMDIYEVLKDSGVKEESKILITNPETVKKFSSLFTDENTETCTPVYTEYFEDYNIFYEKCTADIEKAKHTREYGLDAANHPNWFDASYISWLSYDSLNIELPDGYLYFAPIINWGRYREENGRFVMPVTVRLNHAVADGYLVAKVFKILEEEMKKFVL